MFDWFFVCMIYGLLMMFSCDKLSDNSVKNIARKNAHSVSNSVNNNVHTFNKKMIINIDKDEFYVGDEKALVPIHVFVDYACANCARIDRVLGRLMEDKEISQWVSVSYHQYPLKASSVKPAKIALAAGLQGTEKFWLMSRKLFALDGEISIANPIKLAQEIGLNLEQFTRDLVEKDRDFSSLLIKEKNKAAHIKKVASRMGVFVGGYLYRGPLALENLKKFIMAAKNYNERLITPNTLPSQGT